jgi:hypothetical protein
MAVARMKRSVLAPLVLFALGVHPRRDVLAGCVVGFESYQSLNPAAAPHGSSRLAGVTADSSHGLDPFLPNESQSRHRRLAGGGRQTGLSVSLSRGCEAAGLRCSLVPP